MRVEFFPHELMKEVEELNRDFTRHCKHQIRKPQEPPPSGCLMEQKVR
jgi:hypothetical protein